MMDMDSLASQQVATYSEITHECTNFTKYGLSRWNQAYFERRLETLRALWGEFQDRNAKIVKMAAENQDHDYFTKCYAGNAKKRYESNIEKIYLELAKELAKGASTSYNTDDNVGDSNDDRQTSPRRNRPENNQRDESKFDITISDDNSKFEDIAVRPLHLKGSIYIYGIFVALNVACA